MTIINNFVGHTADTCEYSFTESECTNSTLPSIVLDNLFGLNPGWRHPTAIIWRLEYKTNIISNIKYHEGYLIFFSTKTFFCSETIIRNERI